MSLVQQVAMVATGLTGTALAAKEFGNQGLAYKLGEYLGSWFTESEDKRTSSSKVPPKQKQASIDLALSNLQAHSHTRQFIQHYTTSASFRAAMKDEALPEDCHLLKALSYTKQTIQGGCSEETQSCVALPTGFKAAAAEKTATKLLKKYHETTPTKLETTVLKIETTPTRVTFTLKLKGIPAITISSEQLGIPAGSRPEKVSAKGHIRFVTPDGTTTVVKHDTLQKLTGWDISNTKEGEQQRKSLAQLEERIRFQIEAGDQYVQTMESIMDRVRGK